MSAQRIKTFCLVLGATLLQEDSAAYIASLRAAAKIEIIRENLEKKGG